ncbi:transcriptional regulator, IclR family [Rhodococcus wratislaviensis]|uniref:Transcriptional regulator, IclR family n=1 Tax=Rhodococcus wratislaviensis TaxID=44752 RepID=A0A402C5F2_RHOWR|nr:IclR family transcriptional regulator [Rhodococcus wratislaviensis]GCE38874.1 transcriptional regulator, IclR family [Rhodococcus wratislaviensis]
MRSVRTTFQILEAIADFQPIGLSELSRKLELPKSTVQRSIATLADLGWLRPDSCASTRWVVGDQVRKLSGKVDDDGQLTAAPPPRSPRPRCAATLETVHAAVVDGLALRLVDSVDSELALRLIQPIGTRAPLYAGSAGKAVLAAWPDADVESYLDVELPPIASGTITDPETLRLELKKIRQQGYALSVNELTEGMTAVAACIQPEGSARPVATISINGPSFRITEDLHALYGEKVMTAAREIGRELEH